MSWKKFGEKCGNLVRLFLMPALMLLAAYLLLCEAGNVSRQQQAESLKQMQDTISRAVLNCYAIEGCYPESIDYVEKHYGLQIDHERYDVFYEIFAQNLMPEITVVEKQDME